MQLRLSASIHKQLHHFSHSSSLSCGRRVCPEQVVCHGIPGGMPDGLGKVVEVGMVYSILFFFSKINAYLWWTARKTD